MSKYPNLCAELARLGENKASFADAIGMKRNTFMLKMSQRNDRDFTLAEACKIQEALKLKGAENSTLDYLFKKKV